MQRRSVDTTTDLPLFFRRGGIKHLSSINISFTTSPIHQVHEQSLLLRRIILWMEAREVIVQMLLVGNDKQLMAGAGPRHIELARCIRRHVVLIQDRNKSKFPG